METFKAFKPYSIKLIHVSVFVGKKAGCLFGTAQIVYIVAYMCCSVNRGMTI